MEHIAVVILVGLHLVLPILGIIWMGIRHERLQTRRMLQDSIRTLGIVGTVRGGRRGRGR